jgi:hypothetical protein
MQTQLNTKNSTQNYLASATTLGFLCTAAFFGPVRFYFALMFLFVGTQNVSFKLSIEVVGVACDEQSIEYSNAAATVHYSGVSD